METYRQAVFNGDINAIASLSEDIINSKDQHGNTLLMLAVLLEREDIALRLLAQGAKQRITNAMDWDALSEAVSLSNMRLVQALLRADEQETAEEIAKHKEKLRELCTKLQDFYMEINLNIRSWVPLVSRILPQDTLKIWKCGHVIRVDSQLLDIAEGSLCRNELTALIFIPQTEEDEFKLLRLDHKTKSYSEHTLSLSKDDEYSLSNKHDRTSEATEKPSEDVHDSNLDISCALSLSTPITQVDLIGRESYYTQMMTGYFGFGQPRTDIVANVECAVYKLSSLQFLKCQRTEHISPELKAWGSRVKARIEEGDFDISNYVQSNPPPLQTARHSNRSALLFEEYAAMSKDEFLQWLCGPIHTVTKAKTFSSTLWMSSEFPLNIDDIVALLSPFEEHSSIIQTLVKFLQTKLPSGFPVQLDIPVAPTVTARVTFNSFEFKTCDKTLMAVPDRYKRVSSECS
eukprot:gene3300-5989_t